MLGKRDPGLLDRINGVFICLTVTVIQYILSAYVEKGIYEPKEAFTYAAVKGMGIAATRLFEASLNIKIFRYLYTTASHVGKDGFSARSEGCGYHQASNSQKNAAKAG